MNEEDRKKFESLFQLYDASRQRFNERRNHEFKVGLGFWAVLIAAIAGSITLPELTSVRYGNIFLIVFAGLVILLYILWIRGLYQSAHRDRLQGISYAEELHKTVAFEFDKKTQDYTKKVRKSPNAMYWGLIFHIGVTAFLIIILVLLNYNRFESNNGHTLRQLEKTKLDLENKKIELENQKLQMEIEQLRRQIQSPNQ